MREISNSIFDVRRVEVMVRVITMGMIVVFVVIAIREGPALLSIVGAPTRPRGRLKYLSDGCQCLFSCNVDEQEVSAKKNKHRDEKRDDQQKRNISLFKPHLLAPTSLCELCFLPILLNNAIHLPSFLVNRDQRNDTILVAN